MSNPGTNGLAMYFALDEYSGNRYDKVSGGFITDYNGVNYSDNGKRFRTANFVAANSEYLYSPHGFTVDLSGALPFTWGVWVKPHDIGSDSRIIAKWLSPLAENQEYILSLFGGQFHLNTSDGTTTQTVSSSVSISNWNWYFVCAYYDATPGAQRINIGVNDVWATPVIGPVSINWDDQNDWYVGCNLGTQYFFDGHLDEMFLYKSRLLSSAERTWMYNSGYGRTYEDIAEVKPPSVAIETGLTIGNLPVHVFDNTLTYLGPIEDYYSLSWAERYNEVGDFELELPLKWESSSLLDFGNFLYIKSSDKLMIIEDKKLSSGESETSLLVTGESAESLLKRRIFEDAENHVGPAEIIIYDVVLHNLMRPTKSTRNFALFNDPFFETLITTEYEEQFDPQSIYDIVTKVAKGAALGYKVVCGDFDADPPALDFYVYEGVDRSYAQSANTWLVFSDKFQNVIASSFYSSQKENVTLCVVLTDDVVHNFVRVWIGTEPADLDRIETILETTVDRDLTSPSLTDDEVLAILLTRGREVINQSGPIGILEGDFDIQLNHKYGEDFFMGDIVQCNLHGIEVGARVIELVRSYSAEGEKTYLGLDFIML